MATNNCPAATTQKPFELPRYIGVWYEIYRNDAPFQTGTRCVNATYTANPNGTIGVWNQAINQTNQYINIRGIARAKDPSDPAAMTVVFDNPSQPGDYNVLKSNYNEYALVYSCRFIPNLGRKFEIMWMLSRTKALSQPVYADLKKTLDDMGADTSRLIQTVQNC